jgi:hypothetical protein
MKGRTRWYGPGLRPVRVGFYECHVRIMGGARGCWMLEWDGIGFLVPFPMVVLHWRGMTKAAHRATSKGEQV